MIGETLGMMVSLWQVGRCNVKYRDLDQMLSLIFTMLIRNAWNDGFLGFIGNIL